MVFQLSEKSALDEPVKPLPLGLQTAPSDACSVSDLASSQGGSPRNSATPSEATTAAISKSSELLLPVRRREAVSWCDMLDDEFDDVELDDLSPNYWATSPTAKANETPSKSARRSERRRRRREALQQEATEAQDTYQGKMTCDQNSIDGSFSQPLSSFLTSPALLGTPGHSQLVLNTSDNGNERFSRPIPEALSSPLASPARICGDASSRAPEAHWMVAGSPCRAQAYNGGVMSTSPCASDRPRPSSVCLPRGALNFNGCAPCTTPAGSTAGDASTRTLFPGGSPKACGDASTRTVIPGAGTPALMATSSPKSFFATDASARTPVHGSCITQMSWTTSTLCAEAASPCRARLRMPAADYMTDAPVACSIMSTSPAASSSHQTCWSPMASLPRAPATSPTSTTDTFLMFLGPSDLPSGAELAARLQAAAPESYED
jgi:hypothetical protein